VTEQVENLPSLYEALGSISGTEKERKEGGDGSEGKKEGRKEGR
jgi:hypothetical protein